MIGRRLREGRQEGFTMVELSIVVLIIAILLVISLPTFLGLRRRAQDRAVQSNIRSALASAKVVFTDSGTYTDVTVTALAPEEPSLDFVPGNQNSQAPDEISVGAYAPVWIAVARSDSGTCFALRDDPSGEGGTTYASWTATGSDPCSANEGFGSDPAAWGPEW